jgi:TolB protein
MMMKRIVPWPLLWALLLAWPGSRAEAQLAIDITRGVVDPLPMAVVPFARAVPQDGGLDVASVVQRDLQSSGRFRLMERRDMLSQPTRARDVVVADWKAARNDYVAVGRVVPSGNELVVEFELLNVLSGQVILDERVTATAANLRHAAHRVADRIFERITGVRGAFATRIAYVSVDGTPPNQRYQLLVADADGENVRVILESRQPIMSPAWSADGEWIAYVSFESRSSAVFVQRVRTGERRQVSARAGINGAPAFSPDGRRLALTLGGSSGNLEIYVLDLSTQALQRITDDPAIDTEAAWSPDGNSLYFTSDRAGSPQIYRVDVATSGTPRRVSYGVPYAARPRVSPDGRELALVVREGGNYRIGLLDLASGALRTLTRGNLDEAPSYAPNGAQLIYAGRERGEGVLAAVSLDGLVTQRLKSDRGEVREPVWGPFAATAVR